MRKSFLMPMLSSILALSILAGCAGSKSANPTPAPGESPAPAAKPIEELIIGFRGDAFTLDPHMRNETRTVNWQAHIFDYLMWETDGKMEPQLALSWKAIQDDTWEFKLKQGVKFHNGEPFNAEVAAYSIMRAKTHPKSQQIAQITGVKEAKAIDETTLHIITNGPAPMSLIGISNIAMVPPGYIKEVGDNVFSQKPVGTGRYKFVEWKKNEYLALERNEAYFGTKPEYQKVKFRAMPEAATRLAALLSGEIHVAEGISSDDVPRVQSNSQTHILQTPSQRVIYLTFNLQKENGADGSFLPDKKNPFTDVRVRQAVYHAINIDEIIQGVMGGAASPSAQYIHPKSFGFNPDVKRLPYDLNKAKQLLTDAGYPNGFKVRLDATNDRYINDKQIAEAIGGQLKKVGIEVEVNAYPNSKFFPDMNAGNFVMFMAGWGTQNISNTLNAIFSCPNPRAGRGGTNRAKYCNQTVDNLIAKADRTVDDKERLKLYHEAIKIAQDQDVVWVPLHYEEIIIGADKRLTFEPRFDEYIFAWKIQTVK